MSSGIYLLSRTLIRHPQISSVRLYRGWLHRKPAKVLLPIEPDTNASLKEEKIIDLGSDMNAITKSNNKLKSKQENINEKDTTQKILTTSETKHNKLKKLQRQKFYLNQCKVFDDNGEIFYEKLKENDGRISSLLVRLKSKKERLRSGQMLVEGWRLIVDGLEANCALKYVIFSHVEDLQNLRPFLPKTGVKFYKIPYKEIELWSDVETSSGILGVFETPSHENVKKYSKPIPLQFICDNIRTPGNLGAILRAAVGVGCEKVILSKGCVDLWDPKVIRSASGAHFRQPIHTSVEWDDMPNLLEQNTSVFIADNNTNVVEGNESTLNNDLPVLPYYSVDFANFKHVTLVIGGETEGISESSYRLAAQKNGLRLNIPLQKGVDSLNTGMAAAVIAFEIRKQFIQAWAKRKLENQTIVVA